MNKALVLLALLAVTFAVSTEKVVDNNAADALVNEIQSMEGDIRDEQQRHHELYEEQGAECVAEFEFRQSEISAATSAQQAADAAQGRCENALGASQSDLQKSENYVDAINEILSGLAAQRLAESTSYDALVNQELKPAIEAVEGAFPILRDFAAQAVNFVQFSGHLNKMFTKMIKVNKVNQFSAIVATLLQAPEFQHGIGHDVIEQLELLFDDLLQDLQNALDHATEVENQAIATYEQTVSEYGAILATLNTTIAALEDYIKVLGACITNESQISAEAEEKARRNNEALSYAIDMCQAFEDEYNNSTAARDDELSLLGKLKAFVRQQEDIFGNYGNDGVNSFEEYKGQFEVARTQSREAFMQLKLKQFKLNVAMGKAAPKPTKCSTCSKKSFIQKKLGF